MIINGQNIITISQLEQAIAEMNEETKTHLRLVFDNEYKTKENNEKTLAKLKREYGLYISNELIELMGARNKMLQLTGTQVTSMLSQLAPVRALLETGALGTARTYMQQFKAVYPSHVDVFQDGIDDIDEFEELHGL